MLGRNLRAVALAVAVAATVAVAGATSASAATMPVKTLAKKADAICTMENAKRAKNPGAPKFQDPSKATAAQLKSAGGYLGRDLAITRDEVTKVFALGTPSEPAAAAAWAKLHTTLEDHLIAGFGKAVQAAKAGDKQRVIADFKAMNAYEGLENKLVAQLGLKVCGH
jgi:hypothetical protein